MWTLVVASTSFLRNDPIRQSVRVLVNQEANYEIACLRGLPRSVGYFPPVYSNDLGTTESLCHIVIGSVEL